ncbi:MAG: TIGR04211 family SH3 domain-containing protein [Gammaproteobacteria bacterium]
MRPLYRNLPAMLSLLALLLGAAGAFAQTVYITDQIRAGLHEEKQLDSPIIKTVPTGTALEIIKREEQVSFVREPGGATGWIDNTYLMGDNPGTPPDVQAQNRIDQLEEELAGARREIRTLKAQAPRETQPPADVQELQDRNKELQARVNEEKLKAGELQVQIAELRKRLGMDNQKESLYREIEQLNQKTRQLEIQLARARDVPEEVKKQQALAARGDSGLGSDNWKQLLVYLGIALIVGLMLGVYLMDVVNRRRHGGFRV